MAVPRALDRRVRERARARCEYCQLPQAAYPWSFEIDHIIPAQHRGKTTFGNLALACPRCNKAKGPNLSGLDARTRRLTPLFHPRRDRWTEHFRWRGPRLLGQTPVGRVTTHVLDMNAPLVLELRRTLMAEGIFPPID